MHLWHVRVHFSMVCESIRDSLCRRRLERVEEVNIAVQIAAPFAVVMGTFSFVVVVRCRVFSGNLLRTPALLI